MIASISYSSINDASSAADKTAKKLDAYVGQLEKHVLKKLNNYDGDWTDNIETARNKTNSKISALNDMAISFRDYSNDLDELKKTCTSVDKAVKNRVSTLTGQFKEAHGIRNSVVQNTLSYYFTSAGNSNCVGRYIGDRKDDLDQIGEHIKSKIKTWYNYEGGKEFLKGALVALLEIAIALATLLSGGTIFAIIAAVIALASGVVNLINEFRAYGAAQNGDPALGRRRSEINTAQDWMRKSDNKYLHWGAAAVDAVSLVCSAATLITGVKDLLKNGFKWATGNTQPLEEIEWKNVFSKDTFQKFGSKLKESFKIGGKGGVGKMLRDFRGDFLQNLKDHFLFKDGGTLKEDAKVLKNGLKLGKGFISGGLSFGLIMENLVMPNVSMGNITTIDIGDGGQMELDFDSIKMKDFYDVYDDTTKIIDNNLISNPDKALFNKLSIPSNISVSIPNVQIPQINIPAINAA